MNRPPKLVPGRRRGCGSRSRRTWRRRGATKRSANAPRASARGAPKGGEGLYQATTKSTILILLSFTALLSLLFAYFRSAVTKVHRNRIRYVALYSVALLSSSVIAISSPPIFFNQPEIEL